MILSYLLLIILYKYIMIRRILFFSIFFVGFFGMFNILPAFVSTSVANTQDPMVNDPLGVNYGSYTGLSNQDVRISVALIIKFILGFLALIFLILTLYAGFTWMTSAGNDDQITKAKNILWGAVVGIVIVLFAYAITEFVVKNLYQVSTNKPYNL